MFRQLLLEAARAARRPMRLLEWSGEAADHPQLLFDHVVVVDEPLRRLGHTPPARGGACDLQIVAPQRGAVVAQARGQRVAAAAGQSPRMHECQLRSMLFELVEAEELGADRLRIGPRRKWWTPPRPALEPGA